MGQRELEVLLEELLDVGAADGVGVVDLDDLEDLHTVLDLPSVRRRETHTWMEPKRARWRAAMSW